MAITEKILSGKNWKFRQKDSKKWFKASVPGCVHSDLYNNGLIPSPFFGLNAKDIQWIEDAEWEYKLTFHVTEKILKSPLNEMIFEGLDTFSEVILNGNWILSTENMYVPYHCNVGSYLKKGKNHLYILFKSPYKTPLKKYSEHPYPLPAVNDKGEKPVSPFVRKAPYMYGWDWAPRLLTSGIWKDIRLLSIDTARFVHVSACIIDITTEKAIIKIHCEAEMIKNDDYNLTIVWDKKNIIKQKLDVSSREIKQNVEFTIDNPELWWPKGYGEQNLYHIECIIESDIQTHDSFSVYIGLRTILLKSVPDTDGMPFVFNVNGKDIFVRGANLVPVEYFPSSISLNKYEDIIHNILSANMNMIRIWGGGIYESDYFYQLCDKYGIMVWQDFMFACSMYPSDAGFLSNIEHEIRHQVRRLKSHPSIVLWCGNNEIHEGYHNWGWKEELGAHKEEAWQSYKRIFHEMIPHILKQEDPSRPYWPSSPYPGTESSPDPNRGDFHYWDLIKDIQPYTVYSENIGRFMSEYGFKSYPEMRTLNSFLNPEDLHLRSEALESHQGWETGADLVEKNLHWFYPKTTVFELMVYESQLIQADAVEYAIENHRKAKPFCMGTLYWQLNDCWPAASWSSIDYFGRWKALHYKLKNAFRDIILTASTDDGCLRIFIVSDLPERKPVQLQFRIIDFKGRILAEDNSIHELNPDAAQLVYKQNMYEFLTEDEKKHTVLAMNVFDGNHLLAHKLHFFVKPKDLLLEDPEISIHIEKKFHKYFIFVKAMKLAKSIYITHAKQDGFFSDNFFDLLPLEDKIVVFEPSENCECKLEDFRFLSLWNCFNQA